MSGICDDIYDRITLIYSSRFITEFLKPSASTHPLSLSSTPHTGPSLGRLPRKHGLLSVSESPREGEGALSLFGAEEKSKPLSPRPFFPRRLWSVSIAVLVYFCLFVCLCSELFLYLCFYLCVYTDLYFCLHLFVLSIIAGLLSGAEELLENGFPHLHTAAPSFD